MAKKIVLVLLSFWLSVLGNSGSEGGAFLRHRFGATEMGRGGVALAWDQVSAYSFFYNPALLPQSGKRFAALTFQFMPLDRNLYSFGIHFPLPPTGSLAFHVIHVGVNELYAYNSRGERTGEIEFGDDIVYASFAQRIGNHFFAGINLKYIMESYTSDDPSFDYHSKGRAVDLGFYYTPSSIVGVAFVITDLAGKMASNSSRIYERGLDVESPFPIGFGIGSRLQFIKNFRGGIDFRWNNRGKRDLMIGGEYDFGGIFLRSGLYDTSVHLGAGFNKALGASRMVMVDYAFMPGIAGEGYYHLFNWIFVF